MRILPEVRLESDSRILVSPDGTEVYADAIGDRSKPALVFIHGFSLSTVVFDDIFNDAVWASEAYLVRYDVRGHGRSGKPDNEDAWESQRFAEDFVTVVDAFQLDKPFVVGWSLGATNIADILSFQSSSYLAGIIYIAPVPYMEDIMDRVMTSVHLDCLPSFAQNEDVDAFQEGTNTLISLCSASMSHSLRLACLGSFMVQPRFVAEHILLRIQDEHGLLHAGREDGLPLLLVLGKQDNLVDKEEIMIALEGWMDMKVVEMESDHMPWLGDPVTFRREVLEWVRTRPL